ncbi:MAG: ribosome biogenesis GTP-binding protein YihA/YsxC [Muribaculaceae bacterium]|nr:ribosome biogenesis GTP-binding protein YihA/YsxC [Muribaculaceae bacterium]
MIINTARFVISSPTPEKAPKELRHEYAFIGRSNVGKSSLINMLTGRKDLAMTSSTPGKTMLINHFLINDSWYIVDLPGYGYARRSKDARKDLAKMIKDYILNREQMTNLFVLIDSRHAPQKIDLEFMEWLGENGVPFSIVFTKLDKLTPAAGKKSIAAYCEELLERWEELPPIFRTSSEDRRGRDAILNYIEEMNRLPLWPQTQTERTDEN